MADHAQDRGEKSLSERGRKLFAQPCVFVCAATEPAHFDVMKEILPEVAFVGRSNVGKSSLINGLTGRKGLARASNTPGRTQQINFFDLGGKLRLADLPGYGHAEAPAEVMKKWTGLMRVYLRKRGPLRLVCLLIDARHGAMAKDLDMMKLLDEAAVSYQIVLTKGDLLKTVEQKTRISQLEELVKRHPAARPAVLLTGAAKGIGMDEVRALLASLSENL
jgi:GTP-binding protein